MVVPSDRSHPCSRSPPSVFLLERIMIVVMPEQRAPLIYAARAAIVEIVASLASYAMGLIQALRIHSTVLSCMEATAEDPLTLTRCFQHMQRGII